MLLKEDANGILINVVGLNVFTTTDLTCLTDPGFVESNCHNTINEVEPYYSSSLDYDLPTGGPTSDNIIGNTTVNEDLVH